jgi:hypothetical protein
MDMLLETKLFGSTLLPNIFPHVKKSEGQSQAQKIEGTKNKRRILRNPPPILFFVFEETCCWAPYCAGAVLLAEAVEAAFGTLK